MVADETEAPVWHSSTMMSIPDTPRNRVISVVPAVTDCCTVLVSYPEDEVVNV
jgi:hypothetical protein